MLVTGWPDWSKSRKNALLAGFTSSSLTNLRVQPGTESLNNAVLQMRVPKAIIDDEEEDSGGIVIDVKNKKASKVLRVR